MNLTPLELFTQAMFSEAVGTAFRIQISPNEVTEFRLAEVLPGLQAASTGPDAAKYESFSLMFRGPRFLPQKMYAFQHDKLGNFELFIVPVGREGDIIKYQAVFNRRVPSA